MKIYQVSKRDGSWEHQGYLYFTNKREAEKASKKHNPYFDHDGEELGELNVDISVDGLMKALEIFASHPDNG